MIHTIYFQIVKWWTRNQRLPAPGSGRALLSFPWASQLKSRVSTQRNEVESSDWWGREWWESGLAVILLTRVGSHAGARHLHPSWIIFEDNSVSQTSQLKLPPAYPWTKALLRDNRVESSTGMKAWRDLITRTRSHHKAKNKTQVSRVTAQSISLHVMGTWPHQGASMFTSFHPTRGKYLLPSPRSRGPTSFLRSRNVTPGI